MLNAQRGQTLPFWAFAVLGILAVTFFLASYANTVAWQIHAQNAADSAAAVALSPTTNVANQESVLLYAGAVDEYRLRYLNQAMLNAINQVGCSSTSTPSCATIYANIGTEYQQALNSYSKLYQVLQEADNYTEGGQQSDEKKAIKQLSSFDSAFTYTALAQVSQNNGKGNGKKKNSIREVDIVACHNVPYFEPLLLGLTNTATFQALGRAAAMAVPVLPQTSPPPGSPAGFSEYFTPSKTNPSTGKAYQPNEDPGATAGLGTINFIVDFSGLTVDLNWFQSATIKPFFQGSGSGGSLAAGDYGCS